MSHIQDCFVEMSKHVLKMTKPALNTKDYKYCAYRVDGKKSGRRCAVGALIEDSEYISDMECGGADSLVYEYGNKIAKIKKLIRNSGLTRTIDFLTFVQGVHDDDVFNQSELSKDCVFTKAHKKHMREKLINIGKEYKLNTEFLERKKF